jgi:hypothetical protein
VRPYRASSGSGEHEPHERVGLAFTRSAARFERGFAAPLDVKHDAVAAPPDLVHGDAPSARR